MDAEHSDPDAEIWRYMDFGRFVSLLCRRTLWFAKASTFLDDPFEGFSRVKHRTSDLLKPTPEPIAVSLDQAMAAFSHTAGEFLKNARDHLYVNSWCLDEESMAMWHIYGALGHGVAVKSSVSRYRQAASFGVGRDQFDFGPVTYHTDIAAAREIEHDVTTSIPQSGKLWQKIVQLGFNKRSCYGYEKEWRAVLYQDYRPESGVDIDFDLDRLISGVYVGPRAPRFILDGVEAVMEKFNLHKPLGRSTLLDGPPASSRGLHD